MNAVRSCAKCKRTLTKKRNSARKKYCYRCEHLIRREQKAQAHERRVIAVYGLYPGDYQDLLDAQDGKCAVFGCKAKGVTKWLAVEHDHKMSGRASVRGLCCSRHNSWLAHSGDDPRVFDSIAAYLRSPPARKVLL
jgi:hypothetical protein